MSNFAQTRDSKQCTLEPVCCCAAFMKAALWLCIVPVGHAAENSPNRKKREMAHTREILLALSLSIGSALASAVATTATADAGVGVHLGGVGAGPIASAATESGPLSIDLVPARTAPVNLGEAGHFAILSKSGITDVPSSDVTGDVGTSPITGAADHLTCAEVTGKVYSVDDAGPAPCNIKAPAGLTVAVGDMQAAYTDAAGRPATIHELGGGNIGGLTLAPGVYSWSTDVNISTNVALKGGPRAVWIFQIAKNLTVSGGKTVLLRRRALARNVFWQVAGKVSLGTTSHFEGTILSKTLIAMKTGGSINGRLLSQTAVTLQMNSVILP